MENTHEGWLRRAEEVGRDVLARHAADVDRSGRWPAESVAALGEAGLMGLTLPVGVGGAGGGPKLFAGVTSALARHCASTAMIYLMHACGAQVVAAAPAFPRRDEVLRAMAAGRHLTTLAFSEKGSRSHFWAPVGRTTADGDGLRLDADKSFVTSAGHADSYVVSARSTAGDGPNVSTLYFVPKGAPGLEVGGAWDGLGLRGNASAPVRLEGVRVPGSDRLTGEGEGFDAMLRVVLPWFQLGSAAVSAGITRAAVDSLRDHLKGTRLEHLNQSLGGLMNLRARLARMQVLADTQDAFLAHAACLIEHPTPSTMLAILEVKAAASESALEATDLGMRAAGGAAFARHLSLERNFRDARAAAIMAPTTDVLHDFIGRALLEMPLFGP